MAILPSPSVIDSLLPTVSSVLYGQSHPQIFMPRRIIMHAVASENYTEDHSSTVSRDCGNGTQACRQLLHRCSNMEEAETSRYDERQKMHQIDALTGSFISV